jgi:hypothetical protein
MPERPKKPVRNPGGVSDPATGGVNQYKKIVPIPTYIPKRIPTPKITTPIKVATPDLLFPLRETGIDADSMEDLLFENIGGQEILNLTNTDFRKEIDIEYQPVKNLRDIYLDHSPDSLVGFSDESEAYFSNFAINLDDYFIDEYLIANNGYVISERKRLAITGAVNGNPASAPFETSEVSYDTNIDHGFKIGDTVSIYGIYPEGYNVSSAVVKLVPNSTQFVIDLLDAPQEEYTKSNTIYIDPATGDLVIDFVNIPYGLSVEVEVWKPDQILEGTAPLDGVIPAKPSGSSGTVIDGGIGGGIGGYV